MRHWTFGLLHHRRVRAFIFREWSQGAVIFFVLPLWFLLPSEMFRCDGNIAKGPSVTALLWDVERLARAGLPRGAVIGLAVCELCDEHEERQQC